MFDGCRYKISDLIVNSHLSHLIILVISVPLGLVRLSEPHCVRKLRGFRYPTVLESLGVFGLLNTKA